MNSCESSVACTTTASTIRSPVAASRRRGSLRPRLERAVGRLLFWEGVPRGRARVELTLLDADAMRRLNRRATGRRGLTDVLAFALPQPDDALLGDVYICPAAARRWVKNGGRGKGGGRARAVDGARRAARSGLRPPRWAGPNPVRDVASPGALRTPAPRTRAGTVTLTDAALTLGGALVAGAAALWAGLLALGEEAAVGEALHTLGDAPPTTVGARVPLHRALHVARLALLVLGAVAAGHALGWWGRPWAEALGSWAVAAAFLFIVGDALPRSLARVAPELAATALPLARRTLAPFGPLLWLLAWVDKGLHGLVATPRPLEPDLGAAQRDMLLGVFTLADTRVDEVMTPRLDMVAVDLAAASEEVIEAFRQSEHSRLPVYDGTPDNIAGVVFAKDLVPFAMGLGENDAAGAARWQDLVRPAAFVPETKTLDSQLRDFQRGPAHLAIVVDEFGGTSGLITLEDILEEIVGDIRDEHDVGEAPSIRQDGDRYWVDGRVTLDDLSQALGRPFEHPEVSTVGGLVYSVLGRVPRAGDELTLDGYQVVVERVDRRRVTSVLLQRQR